MARLALLLSLLFAAALLGPAEASAHGLVGRSDLPIPAWLFGWAAAGVLVASFVALAAFRPEPWSGQAVRRDLGPVRPAASAAAGALGVVLLGAIVWSGFSGTDEPRDNLAPTLIFIWLWIGVPVLAALLGDVVRAVLPWRALALAARWAWVRSGRELPATAAWPSRLGCWPAAAAIAAFTWVELVPSWGDDPAALASLAIIYTLVQFAGMRRYGIDRWTERGDGFGALLLLYGRIGVVTTRAGRVVARVPFSGLRELKPLPGTVALVLVLLGSTTWDGAQAGPLRETTESVADSIGAVLTGTIGLALATALAGLVYLVGVAGMKNAGPRKDRGADLGPRFIHAFVPIALGYAVAHYFSLLVLDGQAIASLASDPLGDGSDLFGTAGWGVDFGAVSATTIWYVQVVALVAGHVAALALAHDRALETWRDTGAVIRAQSWSLVAMVGFTCLGLWLISSVSA